MSLLSASRIDINSLIPRYAPPSVESHKEEIDCSEIDVCGLRGACVGGPTVDSSSRSASFPTPSDASGHSVITRIARMIPFARVIPRTPQSSGSNLAPTGNPCGLDGYGMSVPRV